MTAIEKAQEKKKEMAAVGVIKAEHNLIRKAESSPGSKVKAIAAFCFHCMGGTEDEMPDPGWKKLIRTCTSTNCPLYPHRAYTR